MYLKVKQHLFEILNTCDSNTAVICGNELFYETNGEMVLDYLKGWDEYFYDIVKDADFVTEIENMHLYITLCN